MGDPRWMVSRESHVTSWALVFSSAKWEQWSLLCPFTALGEDGIKKVELQSQGPHRCNEVALPFGMYGMEAQISACDCPEGPAMWDPAHRQPSNL